MPYKSAVTKLPVIFESEIWKVVAILSYGHKLGRRPLWNIELYKKVKPENRKPFEDQWQAVEGYCFEGQLTRWHAFWLTFAFRMHGFSAQVVKETLVEEIHTLYRMVQDYMDA
ncbi:hypothetical protein COY32_04625 [candidate division WWE3 bacterium CG_4_10_14_0_2_um_filter_41_14]|uniref:Uncharacterized protein n=1 Tax=candidate division WWE3 bacterium CG_4_10_14_0_2_um_filter_41_14 TaxID=1975072 RepID=A0A2M7THV5_UNCKA|nr:MAG: hypothetical protein COY32_04625 [candidate division WWE3 bacterium CG_4_10_14_0_2_um_filter_41_14]